MHKILNSHHPVRHYKSFKYAFTGIFHALINEPNFRVQLLITFISIFMGFYFVISNVEWGLLIISLGMLLSAEMVNTAIEEFIDHLIHDHHEGAKIIKDLSAGFVLVTAVTAMLINILIFGFRILDIFVS